MIQWSLETLPPWAAVLLLVAHLVGGGAVGVAYFYAVRQSARLFAEGGRASLAVALTLGRLALVGGLLVLASREGAAPLLFFALGFFLARALVLRRVREAE